MKEKKEEEEEEEEEESIPQSPEYLPQSTVGMA
jgi:hypothetical protein